MSEQIQIEMDAVRALAQWKWSFADEVTANARKIAFNQGSPTHVTLSHYRQAAELAVANLTECIRAIDDQERAA